MDKSTQAYAAGGGALLGGIAGAQAPPGTSVNSGVNLAGASQFQNFLTGDVEDQYKKLAQMLQAGPGMADVNAGYGAQQGLAQMLQQYAQGGFMPNQQDMTAANTQASALFNPQFTALNQQQDLAKQQANQTSARLGRPVNDPVTMNLLNRNYSNQMAQLNSNQGAYSMQLAQQMPQQRMGYQQQYSDVMGGLASQALSNRQALLSMGSNLQGSERQYQLAQSGRYQNANSGGGGFAGALAGALGGAGAALGAVGSMGKAGG